MYLKDLIEECAEKYSTQTALEYEDQKVSYAVFYNRVQSLAYYLKKHGIEPGDRIVLLGRVTPHWIQAFFSIFFADAIAVALNILPDKAEMVRQVKETRPRAVFIDDQLLDDFPETIPDRWLFALSLTNFRPVVIQKTKASLGEMIHFGEKEIRRWISLAGALVKNRPSLEHTFAPVLLLYTAGGKDKPRNCAFNTYNLWSSAEYLINMAGLGGGKRLLLIDADFNLIIMIQILIAGMFTSSTLQFARRGLKGEVFACPIEEMNPDIIFTPAASLTMMYQRRFLKMAATMKLSRYLFRLPWFRRRINRLIGRVWQQTAMTALEKIYILGPAHPDALCEIFEKESISLFETCYQNEAGGLIALRPAGAGKPYQVDPGLEINQGARGQFLLRGKRLCSSRFTKQTWEPTNYLTEQDLNTDDIILRSAEQEIEIIGSRPRLQEFRGRILYPEQVEHELRRDLLISDARAAFDGNEWQIRLLLNHDLLSGFYPETNGRFGGAVEHHIRRLLRTLPGKRPEWKDLTFNLTEVQ